MTLIQDPNDTGLEWRRARLPDLPEPWLKPTSQLSIGDHRDPEEASFEQIREYARNKLWVWPNRRICFLSDLHADADAFTLSLVATAGVRFTGPGDLDFELTPKGRESVFVIGGDCFDKGPSNLRLLRVLKHFRSLGAELRILAGNHDLRTLLGIAYAGRREPHLEHLFVRMGRKTLRLFKEVFDEYVAHAPPARYLTDEEVIREVFPRDDWYDRFPDAIRGRIPEPKIAKEVRRIREKLVELQVEAKRLGLSLGMLHASLRTCEDLFLRPDGEFRWYFDEMRLAHREGSFLFVHAGVDDVAAECLASAGVGGLNCWFDELLQHDLFELYHGSIGNTFRTKYRDIDFPFSEAGRRALARAGIYAIVHGHRNILKGARVTLRASVLNFECDASVDRNTRLLEGLTGPGGAAVVFEPSGVALAVSTDYPFVRVFDRARMLPFSTSLLARAS